MFSRFLLIFCLALASVVAFAADEHDLTLALDARQAALWEKATEATMALRYNDALKYAKELRAENKGLGCILEGVVRISIYDDKGDTASLHHAGRSLEKCEASGLWDALRRFEIGYVQGETGHSVKGAMTTRSAAKARGFQGTGGPRVLCHLRLLYRQEFQLGSLQVRQPCRIPFRFG